MYTVSTDANISAAIFWRSSKLSYGSIVSSGSFDYHNNTQSEKQKALEEVLNFIEVNKGKSVMIFTDGSVYGGAVGCGACAAVFIPLFGDDEKYMSSKAVGKRLLLLRVNLKVSFLV